jgi:hypothetical protein
VNLRKSWVHSDPQKLRHYRMWLTLFCLLAMFTIGVIVLTACEPTAQLTVESKMPTNIVIVHEAINYKGVVFFRQELGTVPAGQTVKLQRYLLLNRDLVGWVVKLSAEDPSGKVVWQKTWDFEDFFKLEDVGWKIVVSPETNQ